MVVLATLLLVAVSCSEPGISSAPSLASSNPSVTSTPAAVFTTVPPTSTLPSISPRNQQFVSIVSVYGPIPPFAPAGPVVAITLQNISNNPIISLAATLELNRLFTFNFDVSSVRPLLPDRTISAQLTLITGGFNGSLSYPLTINGKSQNGGSFEYTEQVKIVEPPSVSPSVTTSPMYTPITSGQNSAAVISEDGLSLTLSTDSASYQARE